MAASRYYLQRRKSVRKNLHPDISDAHFTEVLRDARDQHGRNLAELSRSRPVLLVFLRHLG